MLKPQMREEAPPPAYDTLPFATEDVVPGQEGYEVFVLPKEVQRVEDKLFKLGEFYLTIDLDEKKIALGKDGDLTEPTKIPTKVYELLTNKNAEIQWDDLTPHEKEWYGRLLTQSGVMNSKTNPNNVNRSIFNTSTDRWKNLYSHIWHNRWLFKDIFTDDDYKKMTALTKKPHEKMTQDARDRIKKLLSEQHGSGTKTNYVTLPSDPNELVERLELLLASGDAGNTGVHNEIVSICEELRKRKMLTRAQYKQLLSD